MFNAATKKDEYIPDVREILMILWRHRARMILIGGITLALGCGLILLKPKTYTSSATVMLQDNSLELENFKDVTEGAAKFDELTVQTEVRMLSSLNLANQTIRAANVAASPEYKNLGSDSAVVSKFLKNLHVSPQGSSRVIEVSFTAKDSAFAAKVANAHVQSYFDAQIAFKEQRVKQLSGWFEEKVKELKTDVVRKSKAAEEFRAKENLAVGKGSEELVYQQISDISAQLAPIQVSKYNIQAKLQAIETAAATKNPQAVADVVGSRLIQDLKAQSSLAGQRFDSLKSQYGPNHPKYVGARSELSRVNGAISTEVKNIINSLKNEEQSIMSQEELLKTQLAELNVQADQMRDKLISLKAFQVEQEASQKVLDNFLGNYQSIQSQASFARPDAVLISEAVAPAYPSGPGKKLLLLVAMVFAGCCALAYAFAIEMMAGGLRSFEDVRKLGQLPLGILPKSSSPVASVLNQRDSSFKECVKRIYMSGLMNAPARSILVTSAMPNEGRTTFATAMGSYLMSIGHKVIVVDADFFRPDLTSTTKAPKGAGLAEVLAGKISAPQAIDMDKNGMAIMRLGNKTLSSPDILRSATFHDLLEQLKRDYNYVLVDSGPMLARTEATTIARAVDGIIIVSQWAKTSRQALAGMLNELNKMSAPVLGVVINRVDIDKYKSNNSETDFLLPRAA